MARKKADVMAPDPDSPPKPEDPVVSVLREKHMLDLKNLTLAKQPLRTVQFFMATMLQYFRRLSEYILKKGALAFAILVLLTAAIGILVRNQHEQEFLNYARFVLWWVCLGVASSIGLGSGLHTFVLYLGPHIAFFTIKAVQCGRVDLKTAPYDTIQLKQGPSWLEKECSEFGPPMYPQSLGSLVTIPVFDILPQVQLEAILWGFGTALGELPPYFISRAASLSGSEVEAVKELDATSSKKDGLISTALKKAKCLLLSHAQHLNFFTILLLASVPNPLFDLAGMMCGQFGVPFWTFFSATLIGKSIVKTHIQTIFIISLCNNQLLYVIEERLIWILGNIPGFSSWLPSMIANLNTAKEKFISAPRMASTSAPDKGFNLSFPLIWNSVVWLMLINFFVKIVTSTAQGYLKKRQEAELADQSSSSSSS